MRVDDNLIARSALGSLVLVPNVMSTLLAIELGTMFPRVRLASVHGGRKPSFSGSGWLSITFFRDVYSELCIRRLIVAWEVGVIHIPVH